MLAAITPQDALRRKSATIAACICRSGALRLTRFGGGFPLLASRGCPEFCTYCPHRIQSSWRARSVTNILDELSDLQDTWGPLHVVFRDPLFTQERDRVLEMCDGIRSRKLRHTFECETRLDRLDDALLDQRLDVVGESIEIGHARFARQVAALHDRLALEQGIEDAHLAGIQLNRHRPTIGWQIGRAHV